MEERKVIAGEEYQIGYTETYVKVAVKEEKDLKNQMITGIGEAVLEQEYVLLKQDKGE